MSLYIYTAKDTLGKTKSGVVDSRTSELAVNLLKAQGFYVMDIREKKSTFLDQLLDFRGVPSGEVVAFTRQFATMISAGLPVSRALEVLTEQSSNKLFKRTTLDILRSVEGGVSLSAAFARYPNIFSSTYQSLVKAGESSGKLDTILLRLADTMEAERDLNSKFKGAMIYPSIVFVAMIGVFFILMIFVIPKLAEMYESMNVDLPIVTQVMISVSDFMVANKFVIIGGLIFGFLLFRKWSKTETGRFVMTELFIKLPVFGKISKQKDIAQFTRTLSLLISSAVPIVEALKITSSVVVSSSFKKAAYEASKQVEKGNPLSGVFRTNAIFPGLVAQMANVGEETGKMDEVMERVANFYDSEVDHSVKGLSAALEPIILVMLGTMVGFLIISIITPIYKITSAI